MKVKNNTVFVDKDEKKGITDNPLVSIITGVLNGITYLETCIESILNQSYPYIEHVFVDGGSTDGTLDMLSSYKARYPGRIRFISEPDRGPDDAANKGLQMAEGEIIGFLGSDDMSEPDAIMKVVEFFRSNPDAYFVFGECNHINEKGEIIGKVPTKDFNLKEAINDLCYIPTLSSFFRREVMEKIGLFDTSLPYGDLDYLLRIGKMFKIYRIEDVLARLRLHKDSLGSLKNKGIVLLRTDYIASRRHGGHMFSAYGRRYFRGLIIESLRPTLGPIYPLIRRTIKRISTKK